MATDETMFFDFDKLHEKNVKETLKTVYDALEEKGYNPINQIVGYLLSGDPAVHSAAKQRPELDSPARAR